MRFLKISLAALLFSASIASAQIVKAGSKEAVKFDGQTLVLTSRNNSDTESLREYIPAGDNLDSWSRLASVHVFKQVDDLPAAITSLQTELKKQPGDPQVHVLNIPGTGGAVIDFVVMDPGKAFAEFNVMKFARSQSGGIVIYQYAMRAYGAKNIDKFLKDLNSVRPRLVNEMAREGIVLDQ